MESAEVLEILARLKAAFVRAARSDSGLVVVVSKPCIPALDAAIADCGLPRVNVGKTLAENLIELPKSRHPLAVEHVLRESIIRHLATKPIFLDRLQLLFLPMLRINVCDLLSRLAQGRLLVARWPGSWTGTDLVYAEPGHPEYRTFSRPRAVVVDLRDASPAWEP